MNGVSPVDRETMGGGEVEGKERAMRRVGSDEAWRRADGGECAVILRLLLAGAALFAILSLPSKVSAVSNAGTTGAGFLELGVGARAAGMGEANTAWAEDVYGIYFNPSGIARAPRRQIGLLYNNLYTDISYSFLGGIYPLSDGGTIGATILYVDLGSVDRTTVSSGIANRVIGKATASDLAVSVTYARAVMRALDLGITAKVIHEELDRFSATAAAVDLGLKWHWPVEGLTMGLSLSNLGTRLQFVRAKEHLPLTLRLGGAWRSASGRLGLAADAVWVKDQDVELKAGGEFWVLPRRFALRLGANSANDVGSGLTAGAGFRWEDLALDYAYEPAGEAGSENQVSLTWDFGPAREPRSREERATPPGAQPPPAAPPREERVPEAARERIESNLRKLWVRPFVYLSGPRDYDWFGMATMEIFRHDWSPGGLMGVSPSEARFRLDGDYAISGDEVVLTARLSGEGGLLETFRVTGSVARPFPAWDRLLVEVNDALERHGMTVSTTMLPVMR